MKSELERANVPTQQVRAQVRFYERLIEEQFSTKQALEQLTKHLKEAEEKFQKDIYNLQDKLQDAQRENRSALWKEIMGLSWWIVGLFIFVEVMALLVIIILKR